jgi:hypothetical protein
MYTISAYITYLSISAITVLIVGKNLHRNGKNYLFGECSNTEMSESANNFLYVGYCLVNTGFAFFFLRSAGNMISFAQVLEFIGDSQGIIFFSLGITHLINIIIVPKIILYFLNKRLLITKNQKP